MMSATRRHCQPTRVEHAHPELHDRGAGDEGGKGGGEGDAGVENEDDGADARHQGHRVAAPVNLPKKSVFCRK